MEPHEIFNRAYDILVLHAGALDDEDTRTDFVVAFTRKLTEEWRFQGKLGSGGKFYRCHGRLYVSAYPEDIRKGDRSTIIDKCNHLLSVLPYHVPVYAPPREESRRARGQAGVVRRG
jgi:hypothetical protein